MKESEELAARLVEYDDRIALDLLRLIVEYLGGPSTGGSGDIGAMHDFLTHAEVARTPRLLRLSDAYGNDATTAEWKSELAHSERFRALGVALSNALGA